MGFVAFHSSILDSDIKNSKYFICSVLTSTDGICQYDVSESEDLLMEGSKIKVKYGDFEFEAEGPTEVVKEQFEAFKQMVAESPRIVAAPAKPDLSNQQNTKDHPLSGPHISIEKVMHVSGRIISLTALPASIEDAALLIMLGHKDLRNNLAVTGQEIGDGLAQSGRPVPRVDRIMEKALDTNAQQDALNQQRSRRAETGSDTRV